MTTKWRQEWPHWLILAAMFLGALVSWNTAPPRLPVHWGWNGQVDRYGSRFEGLLLLPLIAVGIYLLLLVVPRIDPRRANYPSFAGAYRIVRFAVLAMFAALQGVTLLWIRNHEVNMTTFVAAIIGVVFLVLGGVIGRIRPNWFVGIRTPWTLSSELAWTKTHRLGRPVFIIAGLAMLVAAFTRAPWAFRTGLLLILSGVLALVVYSYIVWKGDPDKTPPALSAR